MRWMSMCNAMQCNVRRIQLYHHVVTSKGKHKVKSLWCVSNNMRMRSCAPFLIIPPVLIKDVGDFSQEEVLVPLRSLSCSTICSWNTLRATGLAETVSEG